ncbi:uncharacterized protein LOC136739150 isoform X2 [Amia ocellicauda]|uniref:uncharacterized protein LOC136739150 isoform X2 n=1 Tax=Amia ocellicauda TaxID=2972642 RepID=UPI003464C422
MFRQISLGLPVILILLGMKGTTMLFSEGLLQAPSLEIVSHSGDNNIKLFYDVDFTCTLPTGTELPVSVYLGKKASPPLVLTMTTATSRIQNDFTLKAVKENEGLLSCWYIITRNNVSSELSLPVNVTITALPAPTISIAPYHITPGRNFTITCTVPDEYANSTLSFYHSRFDATTGSTISTLLGSRFLENKFNSITYKKDSADSGDDGEYSCSMAINYSNRNLTSSKSDPVLLAALPAPTISVAPDLITPGRNFTITCAVPDEYANSTLNVYHSYDARTGKTITTLVGSVFLENKFNSIVYRKDEADTSDSGEYTCRMAINYYNHNLMSPKSDPIDVNVETFPVRLRLGLSYYYQTCAGRLEVFVRHSWGTVCENSDWLLGRSTADVVCKQLGCGQAAYLLSARNSSIAGNGPIALGQVNCSGSERYLRECNIGAVQPSCSHSQDVGVICTGFPPAPEIFQSGYSFQQSGLIQRSSVKIECTLRASLLESTEVLLALQVASSSSKIISKTTRLGETVSFLLEDYTGPKDLVCAARLEVFGEIFSSTSKKLSITVPMKYVGVIAVIIVIVIAVLISGLLYCCYRAKKKNTQTITNTTGQMNTAQQTTEC